jgi:serine/threonine protein kinase/Tfp pilus assembly protein PilF
MSPSLAEAAPSPSAEHGLAEVIEELTAKLKGREAVDLPAYLAAHPQHAAELRRLYPALRWLADFSHSGAAAAPAGSGSDHERASPDGTLGDFRLLREVGRGGMGVVYEAEQISLGRRVALKVLPFASTLDPRRLQRFRNEAHAAAQLHHTSIVPVYATGCERGVHFYAMQYVEGRTLAQVIAELRRQAGLDPAPDGGTPAPPPSAPAESADPERTGPYRPEVAQTRAGATTLGPAKPRSSAPSIESAGFFRTVAGLGIQAAGALEHAHQLGVVHRDIKPGNLLVEGEPGVPTPGVRLWVTDFGLAHLQNAEAGLTLTGDLVGTLRYMSPEQALARRVPIDPRTDVYSLGATLYELLTLEPAFGGHDRQELLRQIAFDEPKPPRRLNRAVPPELETVVGKAMEKDPADRYTTAQELAEDLERFLKDEPIRARRPTLVRRARKWSRRHRPASAGMAIALLAALVVAVVLGFWYQRRLAETDRAVTAALTEAETLLAEGDKQTDQPKRWQATARLAQSAQEKAEGLLAAGVGTERLAARVRQVRAAVDAAVTESRLLVELDRIQLEKTAVNAKENRFDVALAAPLYAKALGGYGIDLAAPEATAALVHGSRLREALLSALADWARVTQDKEERQRVLKVYELALPADSLRTRWMAAVRGGDGAELVKLAKEPAFQDLPPTSLVVLWNDLAAVQEWAAAERLLRAGLERKPGDFWLNQTLGVLLLDHQEPPRVEEAVLYLTVALALRSDSPGVHFNLGNALSAKEDLEGAIRCYRAALQIDPNYAAAHNNLGNALAKKGRLDEAIPEYEEAIRLKKDYPDAHYSLGCLLCDRMKDYDKAIAEFKEVIRLKENYPEAHYCLGNALSAKGQVDKAIAEYLKAIDLKKNYPDAHLNLGNALHAKGEMDEAIAEYRKAIDLKPDFHAAHFAHFNLGNVLWTAKGQLDEAIIEFQAAIRLKKDYAEAHHHLGLVLMHQGRFVESLDYLKTAHVLYSSRKDCESTLCAYNVRQCERLVELEAKLPRVLSGEAKAKDTAEQFELAQLCSHYKDLQASAARFCADAFAAEPTLADYLLIESRGSAGAITDETAPDLAVTLSAHYRSRAARAAALAGCGQGKDAGNLDEKERARLRRLALDWLRLSLSLLNQKLKNGKPQDVARVQFCMKNWQRDAALSHVRGDALAKLPEAERQDWQRFWQEVAELGERAAQMKRP